MEIRKIGSIGGGRTARFTTAFFFALTISETERPSLFRTSRRERCSSRLLALPWINVML